MEILFQLGGAAIMGVICSILAGNRGRSTVGWFFIGFFGGCIGLILVLVLPNLAEQNARQKRLEKKNRLLKEELRLNRQVSDKRHQETQRRLGVHDRAIGVDSSGRGQAMLPTAGRAPPPLTMGAPPAAAPTEQWHYEGASGATGPLTVKELAALWRHGRISPQTLVWKQGMAEWQPISAIPTLFEALSG